MTDLGVGVFRLVESARLRAWGDCADIKEAKDRVFISPAAMSWVEKFMEDSQIIVPSTPSDPPLPIGVDVLLNGIPCTVDPTLKGMAAYMRY